MEKLTKNKPWDFIPLGELSQNEKTEFYDLIADDETQKAFLPWRRKDTSFYENPVLRVGILEDDGRIAPATGYNKKETLRKVRINVFLEKYFVFSMPGNIFKLQFAVGSRHLFEGKDDPESVGHSLAVHGIENDYVNYLGEPVFARLLVDNSFSIDLAVNFISDRSTDRMLSFLEDTNVNKGIKLVNNFNPIFGSVLGYVKSISTAILVSKKNTNITNQHITFVDNPGAASIPLIQGTYILIQPKRDEQEIHYDNLFFDQKRGRVLLNEQPFERNHFLLRIQTADE